MKIAIRGGRIVDPGNDVDAVSDLFIDRGVVAAIGAAPSEFKTNSNIDASDKIVCPGFVDLRARLREPGQEHKATMDSELRAAVSAGITSLCCPPDTYPVIDTPAMVHMVRQRAAELQLTQVHPLGALTTGLAGERLTDMSALQDAGCIGVGNALRPVENTLVMRRAMQYAASFDITVFIHAHDPWLLGNGCVHEGEISTRLGLPAIPEAAETVAVARELALIETTGVRAHFCELSCARAVAMVADAQQRGLAVSADVSAHHLHLTEHDIGFFNTQCHVRPPLRSATDRDALRSATRDNVVQAICSDHQPHEVDAKLAPFSESEPGISGLETLLSLTLKLVADGLLELPRALAAITCGPARVLGIDRGHLRVGAAADICVFDPDSNWVVDPDTMLSRGRNTPYSGWSVPGRVCQTLIAGRVVYEQR
ncbi:MAG: dihydroorotase [Gammaproteobacteria bacterium]|nr:dihydroorotase [Gammaproteobacteria bacterium]MDH3464683.1 dihydroorotase [Gammaproteobacteria bacterium]